MLNRDDTKKRAEEQMRRASSRATEQIARKFGIHFPMWIGCGFPKSGTVWLCRLMSAYLGVPYPQNYALPIAMRAVVHAHWRYHPDLPHVGYIVRDGRDVAVSLYHHQMKVVRDRRHPRAADKLIERLDRLYGAGFDPNDVARNLPRFIEAEWADPVFMRTTWSSHLQDWVSQKRPNVHPITYERLRLEPESALFDLMTSIEGEPADLRRVQLAVARHDFELSSGRPPGLEDKGHELRKGVVGDWKTVFTREAGQIFQQVAGSELELMGYAEAGGGWVSELPSVGELPRGDGSSHLLR